MLQHKWISFSDFRLLWIEDILQHLHNIAPRRETSCLLRYVFIKCIMSRHVWLLQLRARLYAASGLRIHFYTFLDWNVQVVSMSQGSSRSKLMSFGQIQCRPESTTLNIKKKAVEALKMQNPFITCSIHYKMRNTSN